MCLCIYVCRRPSQRGSRRTGWASWSCGTPAASGSRSLRSAGAPSPGPAAGCPTDVKLVIKREGWHHSAERIRGSEFELPFIRQVRPARAQITKSQQWQSLIEICFDFLNNDGNLRRWYRFLIFSCVIQGRQIWICICYVNLHSWIFWQQNRFAVWKLHLHNSTFCNDLICMKIGRRKIPGFPVNSHCTDWADFSGLEFAQWTNFGSLFCRCAEKTSFGFDPALPRPDSDRPGYRNKSDTVWVTVTVWLTASHCTVSEQSGWKTRTACLMLNHIPSQDRHSLGSNQQLMFGQKP